MKLSIFKKYLQAVHSRNIIEVTHGIKIDHSPTHVISRKIGVGSWKFIPRYTYTIFIFQIYGENLQTFDKKGSYLKHKTANTLNTNRMY